ncbi:hypothetical protein AVEN_55711-1 [Araneus ventricosus]|uniref:Uncharacterized protein n=1 Tax=Araneus ventricosus TaxID=182803 RepID=A0A4Y2UEZ7_ARAVE|nr:hypothetical protein AVEN_55711-1 [Araneus ventricosus]
MVNEAQYASERQSVCMGYNRAGNTDIFQTVEDSLVKWDLFFFILRDSANAVPATKNCAPQATAICGCGERQPSEVQWKVSARGSLLLDQGIPSAR